MKQGAVINRIVILLFLGAILLYFGGAAWNGLREPYPTVQAYSFAVEDTVETTGYLVREEQVLSGTGGIVRLIPSEGERVAAGSAVALLYADEGALEQSDQLKVLELEAEQLSAALAAGETAQGENTAKQNMVDALVRLRSAVEKGDFTRLEPQVMAFKSAVYQQAQRYGSADDLSAALADTRARIQNTQREIAQSSGQVSVSQSGIFSGQVDGYETVLTPETLEDLLPSSLDAMEGRAAPVDSSSLGKLITDSEWYFVCPMSEAEARRLTEGKTVTVRFSRDWSGEVDMKVERIGRVENGRISVILSSSRFLSDTTLLRRQTVELVFSSSTGIRVPTQALRMEEDGSTGVYVQVGVFAEFKPVEVLAQGEDYVLVQPVSTQDTASQEDKKALRPGDPVILAKEEIWGGKVLE